MIGIFQSQERFLAEWSHRWIGRGVLYNPKPANPTQTTPGNRKTPRQKTCTVNPKTLTGLSKSKYQDL